MILNWGWIRFWGDIFPCFQPSLVVKLGEVVGEGHQKDVTTSFIHELDLGNCSLPNPSPVFGKYAPLTSPTAQGQAWDSNVVLNHLDWVGDWTQSSPQSKLLRFEVGSATPDKSPHMLKSVCEIWFIVIYSKDQSIHTSTEV